VVYHCAAPRYDRWAEDFPGLQSSIIDATARAGAKLVVIDNAYGYGQTGVLTENTPMQATGKKGALRAQMAQDLLGQHLAGNVQVVLARASDFVGPRVRVAALGERFWPRILAGKKPAWIGNPDLPHSHTNIDDVGRAMITLSNAPDDAYGRAWHVPTAPALSANQIAKMAFAQLDMAPQSVSAMGSLTQSLLSPFIPMLREVAEVRYQCDAPFVLDSSAFEAKFGMAPRSMETTIAETLDWWRTLPPES
jgi:nucleoside-diphosphate-sugar epimerase